MQHYTVRDIMALRPCQPTTNRPDAGYPESKLRMLFGGRQSVTALDICDDERVPVNDRQWVLHRLLPEPLVHEAACRYAERALEWEQAKGYEPDPRSLAAIAAKRRWLRGEISNGELKAAESAAWAAADAVYRDASRSSWAAAEAAAWAAARSSWAAACAAEAAVWDVSQTAEGQWHLDMLREMIEGMEDRNHQQGENP